MEDRVTERGRIAEGILSLVLPAERASAATGDFLEEAGERGGVWFWSSVFRTLAGCVWRDVRESPRKLIWLGVRGYFENLVALWLYAFCFGLATLPLLMLIGWLIHVQSPPVQWGWPIGLLTVWVTGRRSGRSLSRRAPDRKLAACVMFFLVYLLLPIPMGIVIEQFWTPSSSQLPSFSWMYPFVQLVFWVALVYGALRAKSTKPAAPAA
jgi:hypothetical protein